MNSEKNCTWSEFSICDSQFSINFSCASWELPKNRGIYPASTWFAPQCWETPSGISWTRAAISTERQTRMLLFFQSSAFSGNQVQAQNPWSNQAEPRKGGDASY